ncbi:MAG: hypothetical protein WDO74_29875 [Pseudomonadota bacterium]
MVLKFSLVAAVLLGGVTMTGISHAQEAVATTAPATSSEAPASTERASPGHASGLLVQARVQGQSSLLSVAGGPGFLLGYQGPSYALGVGLGLTRIGVNSGGQSASVTLFQVAPTAIIDVWHSADGRARANVIASAGFARASLDGTATSTKCTANSTGGESCTNSSQDESVNATLIPVMLGFGGDYFLSRNFALGAEFGLQALFLASANSNSGSSSQSVDVGGNAQFAYGALRATFVLGD